MPALYMSEQFATAIAEYQQDLGIRPGTLCAYEAEVTGVVNLCDAPVRATVGIDLAGLHCPWKVIAFVNGGRQPTWDLSVQLFTAGVCGIRVPSVLAVGGANLVLWRWNDAPGRTVVARDPLGDLPRDQSSWRH